MYFCFNDTATPEIYTLSLHDALPIYEQVNPSVVHAIAKREPLRAVFRDSGFASDDTRINAEQVFREVSPATDRKSTRLNSSHVRISYAVFCLKKKKTK